MPEYADNTKTIVESTTHQGAIMFQKYLPAAIGVAAFVIGGLFAQKKAVDGVEELRKMFSDDSSDV